MSHSLSCGKKIRFSSIVGVVVVCVFECEFYEYHWYQSNDRRVASHGETDDLR